MIQNGERKKLHDYADWTLTLKEQSDKIKGVEQ